MVCSMDDIALCTQDYGPTMCGRTASKMLSQLVYILSVI